MLVGSLEPPPTFSVGCKRKHVDSPRWATMKLVVSKPLIEHYRTTMNSIHGIHWVCWFLVAPSQILFGCVGDSVLMQRCGEFGVSRPAMRQKRFKQQNFQWKKRRVNWVLQFNWVLSHVFGCSLPGTVAFVYRPRGHCLVMPVTSTRHQVRKFWTGNGRVASSTHITYIYILYVCQIAG